MPKMKSVKLDNGVEIMIDVTSYVKWEKRAAAQKKTVCKLLSNFLSGKGTTNP